MVALQDGAPPPPRYSSSTSLAVREEMGFDGVREQDEETRIRYPTKMGSSPLLLASAGGIGRDGDQQRALAAQYQAASTSRQWAPSPMYPGQQRAHDLRLEVIPKNVVEYEAVGRGIGPHSTSNVLGGYLGMDKAGEDVTEKFTQRTVDDFKEEFHPTGPRKDRGNASVYSLFDQNRIEARELSYKDAPGRFAGAFNHDIRLPNHPTERLWHSGAYANMRPTAKADDAMVNRQRAAEAPNRDGLRPQTSQIYATGWEKLELFRRKETQRLQDIDVSMIQAYNINPYTVPIGIVPFSGQNSTDLNALP